MNFAQNAKEEHYQNVKKDNLLPRDYGEYEKIKTTNQELCRKTKRKKLKDRQI